MNENEIEERYCGCAEMEQEAAKAAKLSEKMRPEQSEMLDKKTALE